MKRFLKISGITLYSIAVCGILCIALNLIFKNTLMLSQHDGLWVKICVFLTALIVSAWISEKGVDYLCRPFLLFCRKPDGTVMISVILTAIVGLGVCLIFPLYQRESFGVTGWIVYAVWAFLVLASFANVGLYYPNSWKAMSVRFNNNHL